MINFLDHNKENWDQDSEKSKELKNKTNKDIFENFGLNNHKLYRKFNIAFYHYIFMAIWSIIVASNPNENLWMLTYILVDIYFIGSLNRYYPRLKKSILETNWDIVKMEKIFQPQYLPCDKNLFKIVCIELWYDKQCQEIFKKYDTPYLPKI